jgi:hypothetical protein
MLQAGGVLALGDVEVWKTKLALSRGGKDVESNWATTTMLRNSAKANFTLDELGWSLFPPGDMKNWDGLLGWFVDQVNADRAVLNDPYLRRWFGAARPRRATGR